MSTPRHSEAPPRVCIFQIAKEPGRRFALARHRRLFDAVRACPHDPNMYRRVATKRFGFPAGRTVAGKYVIERPLGSGWEGEVYVITEKSTGIRRAAKFYYPHRDPMGKAAIAYARKLDALRHCPILMQYHHQEIAYVKKRKVVVVISELVEGQKLSEFLKAQQ